MVDTKRVEAANKLEEARERCMMMKDLENLSKGEMRLEIVVGVCNLKKMMAWMLKGCAALVHS